MRYMSKPIVSNILLLIESILLFIITIIFSLKLTILNEKTIIKNLEKTNYYEKVYNDTIDTMSYITRKSGISSKVISGTFTEEDMKNDINKYVKSFYKGEKVEINTEHVKENITRNLEQYIEEKKLEINETQKNSYIEKMTTTYKNKIRQMNNYSKESEKLKKYNKLSSTFLLLFIIDLVVLIIINNKIFNKKEYNVILLTSIISLLCTNLFINTLNIKNLFIYNNALSEVLKNSINKIQIINIIFVIIYIIILKLIKEKREN